MKNQFKIIVFICLMTLLNTYAFAQKNPNKQKKAIRTTKVYKSNNHKTTVVRTNQFPRNKVVVVKQRRIRTVPNLAAGHTTVVYSGRNYYYHEGRYYNQFNNNYNLIVAPRGLRVRFLPIGNRMVIIRNVPHYYYAGTYYKPVGNEYEVVQPSVGTVVPELPEDNVEEITIDGQNYLEYDDVLYKTVVTTNGIQYEVVGRLDD